MLDLFDDPKATPRNLLPCDGEVHYYGPIMNAMQASQHFSTLLTEIDWQHDTALIMGRQITTKRKVAWYGDQAFQYTYSHHTKIAQPWNYQLLRLKALVEAESGASFNACLLNLYHDGSEGMAWHSDAEKDLQKHGVIASLSFGAERKFSFKHKQTQESTSVVLQHGSLLIMKGCTQDYWLHRLPPSTKVLHPRISLTFRTIVNNNG
ncbi:alpha-ketoglutarate-dependent dioxygenase AlkB [Marinomonas agarivorans]|nr:alpha-ketoglutarate-dependent dioxygenase AlkB [Marinomonas agarivorans]